MHLGARVVGISTMILTTLFGAGADAAPAQGGPITLEAEAAQLDPNRTEIVAQESFASKRGVALKAGVASNVGKPDTAPDLVFRVRAPQAGRYWIRTHAATDAHGTELMRRATGKQASLRLMISVDGSRPTSRVVFVPWSRPESCTQATGKFDFNGQEQEIRVWLPAGVRLDYLQVSPYVPPRVPAQVEKYQPTVVPPKTRPRIWVNAESLPQVRANLTRGENAPHWKKVQEIAAEPFEFQVAPNTEVSHNAKLEQAATYKAFVYLMAGDKARGREAVTLIRDYLSAVQFDNLLDITREIGRAIYSAALVYDWCYDLMTPEERESIRKDLMRLADDMEIGWPPFRQTIVNGHGNEAQVNRDLLCMAIALYDEDPVPYRYCAYRILEELVPMRRFEYQSPRHNQGISYGPYRFGWDLHAAWLFRRMTGKPVFDDNIGEVYKFWLYTRLPIGQMLRDGDGFSDGQQVNLGLTPLLAYAYTRDPVIKGDFVRQGFRADPLMILLLNDPELPAQKSLDSLPLTLDFGPILGSMVARTGWNLGRNLADVVVEMKGGGYHFGNHQHADAGSFQIYYRGLQAVDLGQYRFYGTPYDSNFCKRSVSHSMMLVVDPDEKFGRATANDGGARFVQACPVSVEQVTNNPMFANGKKVSSSFGPSPQRPFFSYFSVDLKSAYSDKIQEFVRTFCFLNLGNEETPAALIILDQITAAKPEFQKYWQVNTLNPPEPTPDGVILRNSALGLSGKVSVRMLRPRPEEREVQILSGEATHNVFGQQFTPPSPEKPEGRGHRVLFSPKTARASDLFLTVLPISDAKAPELPVSLAETETTFALTLADRVVVLSKSSQFLKEPFQVQTPAGEESQLLLTGLAPGAWSIRTRDNRIRFNARVEAGKNTAFFVVPGGDYEVRPETIPGVPEYQAPPDLVPALAPSLNHRVLLNDQVLPTPPVRSADTHLLVPALAVFKALGIETEEAGGALRVRARGRSARFVAGSTTLELNGRRFQMPGPAVQEKGEWYLPDSVVAAVAGQELTRDQEGVGVTLAPSRIPGDDAILWIEANKESDLAALRAMLADIPGRREYWAAEGKDVHFDLVLARPVKLRGVGIRWHQGAARQARFALETSSDGVTWRKVFDGASSGRSADLETYTFDPHEAGYVRFRGFGNTQNGWNSIVHFRLLPAEP